MTFEIFSLFILISFSTLITGNNVERDKLDSTHGWGQCAGFDRATGDWWGKTCTCKKEYTTMMSVENKEYDCKTITEVGCDYNLQNDTQVYLITSSNDEKELIDFIDINEETSPQIRNISTWDYDLYKGHWNDITSFGIDFFSVRNPKMFTVQNLDLKIWGGHVVKISFDNDRCLLIKVKGGTKYPLSDEVKQQFVKKAPPTDPPTQKPQTDPPTQKPHTEKPVTTKLPEVTPKPPAKQTGSESKKTIIVLVSIAAVIILSLIAAIIYKNHKKKSETIHSGQQQTDAKVPNMYPDVSMVNNSYEPASEYYTVEMTKVNNGTAAGVSNNARDNVETAKEFDKDINETGDPTYSSVENSVDVVVEGDCEGIENPSYMCQVENVYVDIDDNSENVDENNDTTTPTESGS